MRLFIAINFNDSTRDKLRGLRDDLRGRAASGNYSKDENLHLTLVFLGECGAQQTSTITDIMDAVNFEPPDVIIERVGRFKRDGGDIWWAGVRENQRLSDLQSALTRMLSAEGFAVDKRKYSPHITLGREVVTNISPRSIEPFGETVNSIDLMKSERIDGKLIYTAIYTRIKRASLTAPPATHVGSRE